MFEFKVSHPFDKRHPFPLDAEKIAVLLKHYAGQCSSQVAVAQAIFTQIPDTDVPQNPNVKSEPSLNNRAPDVAGPIILNASLGKRPLPIQARQDRVERRMQAMVQKCKRVVKKMTGGFDALANKGTISRDVADDLI